MDGKLQYNVCAIRTLTSYQNRRLVCAKRTFTWKELHVALSIDVDRQILDYEDKRMHEHVFELCGPLILVNGDRVSLVHSTAKTYVSPHAIKAFLS